MITRLYYIEVTYIVRSKEFCEFLCSCISDLVLTKIQLGKSLEKEKAVNTLIDATVLSSNLTDDRFELLVRREILVRRKIEQNFHWHSQKGLLATINTWSCMDGGLTSNSRISFVVVLPIQVGLSTLYATQQKSGKLISETIKRSSSTRTSCRKHTSKYSWLSQKWNEL